MRRRRRRRLPVGLTAVRRRVASVCIRINTIKSRITSHRALESGGGRPSTGECQLFFFFFFFGGMQPLMKRGRVDDSTPENTIVCSLSGWFVPLWTSASAPLSAKWSVDARLVFCISTTRSLSSSAEWLSGRSSDMSVAILFLALARVQPVWRTAADCEQ